MSDERCLHDGRYEFFDNGPRRCALCERDRYKALLYRATAPTASLLEEEDRQAAIREGYELTRPTRERIGPDTP